MKPTFLLLCLGLALTAHASWWSPSKPAYTSWSPEQLSAWLQEHNIPLPERKPTQPELTELVKLHWDLAAAWTHDQYSNAQKAFTDVRDTSFDKWDESHLREFLLKQGIVAPKGPKEKLVQLARNQYKAYTNAASSYSSRASTAVYGDATFQATQSLSSLASRATDTVSRTLDDTKDYVYSTWDDNRIRNYLESKGVQVKEKAQKNRKDLLGMMRDAYARVTRPVWEAWSDSYLHEWLVAHNIISPAPPAPYSREYLLKKMTDYYDDANETVYSSWSESQLRDWLIKKGIVKPDAQIKREELLKLVEYVRRSEEEAYERAKGAAQEKMEYVEQEAGRKYSDAEKVYERGKGAAQEKMEYVEQEAGRKYSDAEKAYEAGKERAYEKGQSARESVGEKVKFAGEKIKGEKGKVKGDKTEL